MTAPNPAALLDDMAPINPSGAPGPAETSLGPPPRDAAADAAAIDDEDDAPEPRVARRAATPGERSADAIRAASDAGAQVRRAREGDEKAQEAIRRFMSSDSDGYFSIERVGPSGMPETEFGVIGQITVKELTATPLREILSGRHGGGTFTLVPHRSDHSEAQADRAHIKIAGDPKPMTAIGKAWLRRAQKEGSLDEPVEPRRDETHSVLSLMMEQMRLRDAEQAREREREREDRKAAEAERQRQWDAKLEREREDRKAAEKQAEEDRKRQREEAEAERKRMREEAEADRRRQREDDKERRAQEHEILSKRLEAERSARDAETNARIAAIQQAADLAAERSREEMKLQAKVNEHRLTNGLGFDGIGKIRDVLAEGLGKKLTADLGLDEEEDDNTFGGAIAAAVREVGPDLLRTAGETLLPRLAALMPGGPTPQPQHLPHQPARAGLPPVSGPAAEAIAPIEPDDAVHDDAVPPAPALAVATPQAHAAGAKAAAIMSVLAFVRPLAILLTTQPVADAAWSADVSEDKTLADVYQLMTRQARVTLETQGWEKFMELLTRVAPKDAEIVAAAAADEGGADWLREFLAAGPWYPETTE